MHTHPTRRQAGHRTARTMTVAAMAALLATLSTGPALAGPDERVLERQGMIQRQTDKQTKAEAPARQEPDSTPGRFFKPEPKMDPGPWVDDGQRAPAPAPTAGQPDAAIPATVALIVLALAVGVAAWWVRHRRPPPEPTT